MSKACFGPRAVVKRAAVLLDLGFLLHEMYVPLGRRRPTAAEVHAFAHRCVAPDESLFRVFAYHSPPYAQVRRHPMTGEAVDFSATETHREMSSLLSELPLLNDVAFRCGEISFAGWVVRPWVASEMARTGRAIGAGDFAPDIRQKQVDMKIGLDVAWLASNRIVDRIILVTADRDFIPAMKFARREGVQIVVAPLGRSLHRDLQTHADEVRPVDLDPAPVPAGG